MPDPFIMGKLANMQEILEKLTTKIDLLLEYKRVEIEAEQRKLFKSAGSASQSTGASSINRAGDQSGGKVLDTEKLPVVGVRSENRFPKSKG